MTPETLGVDKDNEDPLYRQRHSLAHVMAQAVLDYRPGSLRGFGPPVDNGFYYDFILSAPISPEDFPEIEKRMRKIIAENQEFRREDLPVPQALARLEAMKEPYKVEYAKELARKQGLETLRFFTNGPFVDLCEGPHVASTRALPPDSFKLRSVAGAYWRGDERNSMMTRLYAWGFENKKVLDEQVARYEALQASDHKKLGPFLDLFVIDPEVGKGLPLWLPNGTAIRDELEKLAREEEFRAGYHRVATPHITRERLYELSGHLSHYRDKMYPPMVLEEEGDSADSSAGGAVEKRREVYWLKPMNCPHHHRIFASRPRSYRDLPLRLAEYGQVYRFEASGELSGLLRVRGMCMNDAHIYCTQEQIKDEFIAVMKMHERYFRVFGFADFYMRLSLRDPADPKGREKYVDAPELWRETEDLVRQAMRESGLPFREALGEAAFYGPKIDVQFKTVTGREETFCTNQLDFAVPRADRMNLTYTGPDGKPAHPYVIHRAPLGTHERFIAYLIEHFGGAFPTWLAPVQVRVLPVSEKVHAYASRAVARLREEMVRAEMDGSSEKIGKKLRESLTHKIPNLLVVGEKEAEAGTVTVRRYGEETQATVPLEAFVAEIVGEIKTRALRRKPSA